MGAEKNIQFPFFHSDYRFRSGVCVSIVCAAALFPLLVLLVANRDIPIIRFTLTLVFGFRFLFDTCASSGGDSPKPLQNNTKLTRGF